MTKMLKPLLYKWSTNGSTEISLVELWKETCVQLRRRYHSQPTRSFSDAQYLEPA